MKKLLLAWLLVGAPAWADDEKKAEKTTKKAAETGGQAVVDGAETAGKTVGAFFTGGTKAAKKEAKKGAAKTKKDAKANAKETKAAAQ
jgi:hypothetical protein